MRAVKIRVWDTTDNCMYYDVTNISDVNGYIMLWTGLLDKNGREIYEGDLLTDYGKAPPLYVEYSEKHGAYCFVDKFDPSGTVYYTPPMIYYEQMEVIGNVFENPELLKEGEE